MKLLFELFAGLIFIPLINGTLSAGPNQRGKTKLDYDKQLIFVSTVDGKLSALDLKRSGQVLWTINVSDGPLISSSITNLVYKEEGKTVRLIPSLHGGLFKFNGDTVEAVPFNVDTLLKSSFRLAENTVLVGGKETHFTGVDIQTGEVLYSCNVKGCDQQQTVPDTSNIIVVKRFQQTVRSIENRNGAENWNFSVGEVELQYVKGSGSRLLQNSGEKTATSNSEEFQFEQKENIEDSFDFSDLSRIKFVVPDGTVCVVKPSNKQTVLWKYTFSAAISSAWVLFNNQLQKLDMFDASKVPALGKDDNTVPSSDVIYMGTYDKQVYVQASPSVQLAISQAVVNTNVHNPRQAAFTPPRFTQKPCHSKSKFLTIAGPESVSKSGKQTALVPTDVGKLATEPNKHVMFCPDNTKKKGYYFQGDLSFYARIQQSGRKGRNTITTDNNGSQPQNTFSYLDTLSFYFVKYLMLTLLALIAIPFLILYLPSWLDRKPSQPNSNSSGQSDTASTENMTTFSPVREYESRFLQDFEPQECLGKGGFGVVFKAKNRMDDCSYAVKRILLPHSKSAREKVWREVRALAQLDHPSIIRYFNAWSEQPPIGWQKKQDDKLANDLTLWSSMPQPSELNKHSTSTSTNSSRVDPKKRSISCTNGFEVVDDETKNFFGPAYSQGFSFHAGGTTDSQQHYGEEQYSGSWADNLSNHEHSVPETVKGKFFQNDSSDSDSSSDCGADGKSSLPFKQYQNDDNSMSVVFGEPHEKTKQSQRHSTREKSGLQFRSSSTKHSETNRESLDNIPDVSVKIETNKTSENNDQSHDTVYLYIQMQLCKKESLKEWLVVNVHREKSVYTKIFSQVVKAVKYVHDRGLIHRDLKPSNVLFSLDDTIKVGDFGLATHAGEISSAQLTVFDEGGNKQHTRQAGTTLYMAPEQMSSCLYTEKVDIFALGLILFELVYSFDTQMEKVRHFSDARQLKFPKNFCSNFPQESTLIHAMLREGASSRPTAQEIIDDNIFN